MILSELCAECRNWFSGPADRRHGLYRIEGGELINCPAQEGQFFRIVGSIFNDGVHCHPAADLTDEVFEGTVWLMRVPHDFLGLAAEIEAYQTAGGSVGPYTSESFGGYSYERATDAHGAPMSWQTAFRGRLNAWRKL